jgi:hypothetical protein
MKPKIKTVYKIVFPNNKIYIGSTIENRVCYIGNAACYLLERDFTPEELSNFTIRKEILWQSKTAATGHVRSIEQRFILEFQSNCPAVGYNLRPVYKPK